MALKTQNVHGQFLDQDGNPLAGVIVRTILDRPEVDAAGTHIKPVWEQFTADANGNVTLSLWPNALGTKGSRYNYWVINPKTKQPFIEGTLTVPDTPDTQLSQISDINGYPAKDAAVIAVEDAQAAAIAAEHWANYPENSLIPEGDGIDDYSAKHFSNKSAASASAAATSESKAASSKAYAQEWANAPENTLITAAAGGDGLDDYSSMHHAKKAGASEVAAKTSETNAKNSETAAKTSETNAKASETAAKTSETNAKTSETNADTSELQAQKWATQSENTPAAIDPNAVAWAASTAYLVGHLGKPTTANGYYYEVTTAGTTGTLEPVWPTVVGSTVTDGTAVWTTRALYSSLHHAKKSATSASAAKTSETNAGNSAAAASTSETNAKTSETNAKTSETNSKSSETAAANSKSYAQEWANAAENVLVSTAAGGDGIDDYSALHQAKKAEASKTAAATSETNAKTSETNAKTSETNAKSSETAAGNSKAYAQEWANAAENTLISAAAGGDGIDDYSALHQAKKAEASKTAAATSETNAANSASAASTSETNAKTSETNAKTSETNADASELQASKWAENPENTPAAVDSNAVTWAASTAYTAGHLGKPTTGNGYYYEVTTAGTTGTVEPTWPTTVGTTVTDGTAVWTCRAHYSALHWAKYAESRASGALQYKGSHDASLGTYPGSPQKGDFWKISVQGVIDGVTYRVGDSIIYNGGTATSNTGWDHIDNTESVTSVQGRVGAVVVSRADLSLATTDAPTFAGLTLNGNQSIAQANFLRFPHANESDSNDGKIGARLFEEGLNIVGSQTTVGEGRKIRTYGTLHMSQGGIINYGSGIELRSQMPADGGATYSPPLVLRGHYDSDGTTGVLSTKRDVMVRNEVLASGAYGLAVVDDAGAEIAKFVGGGGVKISRGYGALDGINTVLGGNGTSPYAGSLAFGDGTGWKFQIGHNSSGTFQPKFTFVDHGRLGIGTQAPDAPLDVAGHAIISGDVRFSGTSRAHELGIDSLFAWNAYYDAGWKYRTNGGAVAIGQQTSGFQVRVAADGTSGGTLTWTSALEVLESGRVLIGTTTDDGANLLQAQGHAVLRGDVNMLGDGSAITSPSLVLQGYYDSNATTGAVTPSSRSYSMRNAVFSDGTYRLVFTNNAGAEKVLIHDNGGLSLYTDAGATHFGYTGVSNYITHRTTGAFFVRRHDGTNHLSPDLTVNGAGRVLIGTTTDDGSHLLQVNGSGSFNGGVTLWQGALVGSENSGGAALDRILVQGQDNSVTSTGGSTQARIRWEHLAGSYHSIVVFDTYDGGASMLPTFSISSHATWVRRGKLLLDDQAATLADGGSISSIPLILRGYYDSDTTTAIVKSKRDWSIRTVAAAGGAYHLGFTDDTGTERVRLRGDDFEVGASTVGKVGLGGGTTAYPGYVEFHTSDNIRRGYIGYGNASNQLSLQAENGWSWYVGGAIQLSGATTIGGLLTANGGSKLVVQNGQDGGSSRGIYLWSGTDTNWGIYMAQAGAGKSLAGGAATAGFSGRTAHMIRFRVYGSTGNGFLWENGSESALAELTADTGHFYTKGQIIAGNNLTVKGGGFLNTAAPTLYLQDTDHRSAMVHVNSNKFYVLRGSGINSTTWAQTGRGWPLEIDLETNYFNFGGSGEVRGDLVLPGGPIVDGGSSNSTQLILRGYYDSDGTTAVVATKREVSLRNLVDGAGNYQLQILNDAGSALAWFNHYGDLQVTRHLQASSHVSMGHAVASRTTDTVFYSSTDSFIRKNDAAGFRSSLSVYSKAEADNRFVSSTGNATFTGTVTLEGPAATVDGGSNNSTALILRGYYDSDTTTAVASTKRDFSIRNFVTSSGVSYLEFLNDANTRIALMRADGEIFIGGTDQVYHKGMGDSAWIAPTLQNGWVNYGGAYSPAGYRIDAEGWVHLRGLVKSGTVGATTPVFTLPSGYLPEYQEIMVAISSDTANVARVDVKTNGEVVIVTGSNAWISLDGIKFKAV